MGACNRCHTVFEKKENTEHYQGKDYCLPCAQVMVPSWARAHDPENGRPSGHPAGVAESQPTSTAVGEIPGVERPSINAAPTSERAASTQASSGLEWYYSAGGQRFGPANEAHIVSLMRKGEVTAKSLVWNHTFLDWLPASATTLAPYLMHNASAPPPLTGAAVDNTLIWFLAFAPLIGLFLQGFLSGALGIPIQSLWFTTLALNIVLSLMDAKKLKAAGHDTSKMGGAWLVPVYLYKRAQILNQSKAYFIVWCVLFGLLLIA